MAEAAASVPTDFLAQLLDAIAAALEKHGFLRVATDQLDYFLINGHG